MTTQPEALRLAQEINALFVSEWGMHSPMAKDSKIVLEELRRLHTVNHELGAALRRLISYCNTLENRLMEADGEHPALQEAKEAYAKVEGKA
jgi:hypothetical protein